MDKIKALIIKDFFTAKNSVKTLAISYGVFLFVLFTMKDYFKKLSELPDNILVFVATIIFVSMGLLFITAGFMRYIFQESSIGKEEIYFAYGYGVGDICLGKSFFFTIASLIIPYLLVFTYFAKLLSIPFFLFNIFVLLPLLFLIMSYLVIFFTWFTRLGMSVYFILFFGVFFLFSKLIKKVIRIKLIMNFTTILLIEIGIIILLSIIAFILTKLVKKERLVEKLS